MNLKLISGVVLSVVLASTVPAVAKAKKKSSSGAITGIYCEQGPDNIFIGASTLKPSERKGLRKGQKARVNIAGVGPIWCVVR